MKKRKTAGELSLKALSDRTKYDPLEVAYALTDDVIKQLEICAHRHEAVFDEDEFFLCLFVASDPLIAGLRRHKYAAFLHMPKPRPQQSCYLYNKKTQKIKRLWTLPDAKVMAITSSMAYVAPKWRLTQGWCKAFYHGWKEVDEGGERRYVNTTPTYFFNYIRKQWGINHLSEDEFLDANREELIKAGYQDLKPGLAESFDFAKIAIDQIVDTKTVTIEQDSL